MRSIRASELKEKIAAGTDLLLLDVREIEEFTTGHLPSSVNIPLGILPLRLAELPKDKEIIVICRSGSRSAMAVNFLTERGYTATNLIGGLISWQ